MADLLPQDRLQPALLDRLIDDDPGKKQEPRENRVISKGRLRQAVLRDLAWLFNSTRLSEGIDWSVYPYAERSVLNYGLPPLSGETASTLDVLELEQAIRQAIFDFEPRILLSSLQVQALAVDSVLERHNVLSVQIQGDLWGQPVPIELLLRTDVDLETGKVEILDLSR